MRGYRPEAVAVMVPLFTLQADAVETAVTAGALALVMVTVVVLVHPLASFTETV